MKTPSLVSLSCLRKFLKLASVACLASRRLNFSASIISASLTILYSLSPSSVLMFGSVSLRSGVLLSSGDTQVVISGVVKIGVTCFGVDGPRLMCGIYICGQVMMSGVSFNAAGCFGDACMIRASIVVRL